MMKQPLFFFPSVKEFRGESVVECHMIDKSIVLLERVEKDLSTWVEEIKGFKVFVENW